MADINKLVDEFATKLKRRQVEGSLTTAKRTAELLRQVVSHQRLPSSSPAPTLLEAVKTVGIRLIAANPTELTIGNIVRRVLHIIREEDVSLSAVFEGKLPGKYGGTADGKYGGTVDGNFEEGSETGDVYGEEGSFSAVAVAAATRSFLRAPSLHNLLESVPAVARTSSDSASSVDWESRGRGVDVKSTRSWKLKHNVIEGISELLEEIVNFRSQLAEQALEHIHQNEVILTFGRSRTLLTFLLEAKKKRSFQVIVAEGAPRYDGHLLARDLSLAGLPSLVLPDSSVPALLPRVHLCVVGGARAVMANGGALAPTGAHAMALAARACRVPAVILAPMVKLCPMYPHNPRTMLNDMRSPSEVLDLSEFSDFLEDEEGGGGGGARIQVVNPSFDYIPPELISLFITDTGGHNPSYVYRLLAEYYSPEDSIL